jgi:hypothetical protein
LEKYPAPLKYKLPAGTGVAFPKRKAMFEMGKLDEDICIGTDNLILPIIIEIAPAEGGDSFAVSY